MTETFTCPDCQRVLPLSKRRWLVDPDTPNENRRRGMCVPCIHAYHHKTPLTGFQEGYFAGFRDAEHEVASEVHAALALIEPIVGRIRLA